MRGRPDRYPERVLTSPRSRSLRLAAAVAALAPVLAACGMNVQTTKIYQPGVGVNARDGQVDVLAAVVVADKAGQGRLLATLVNDNQTASDTLSSVTASGGQVAGSPVQIPARGLVNLAQKGGLAVTGNPGPGASMEITFTFANAPSAKLMVPIVAAKDEYASYAPGNSPSPSSSPTPSQPTKSPEVSNPTMPTPSASPTH